jgi:hypothetical protein
VAKALACVSIKVLSLSKSTPQLNFFSLPGMESVRAIAPKRLKKTF